MQEFSVLFFLRHSVYAYAYYTSAVYIQANILIEVLHGVAKNGIYVNSSLVYGFICILLSMWLS